MGVIDGSDRRLTFGGCESVSVPAGAGCESVSVPAGVDANHRWPDQLARRLIARTGGRQRGVMNQGLGGNRILHDGRGDSGLRRFDRDVLSQPGVTHVIILLGINDIRNRGALLRQMRAWPIRPP
jgi:lysophospholipase L1-like esterase